MTYGTEDMQWDGGVVRCKCLEKAQRLQSGSPYTSTLSSRKTPKSCHLWRACGRTGSVQLSPILQGIPRTQKPRKINYFIQGLRRAKRWSWDLNSVQTSCCFWIQFPSDPQSNPISALSKPQHTGSGSVSSQHVSVIYRGNFPGIAEHQ